MVARLPRKIKRTTQPQGSALLPRYARWECIYAPSVGVNNLGATKIAGVFNGSAGYGGANKGGKAYALGSTLTSTLQLGNTTCKFVQSKPVSGLIVFRPTLAANRVPLFIASSSAGGLYVKVSPTYALQIDATTVSNLITGTAGEVKFNEVNTVAFCIEPRVVDGGTGRVAFALNGKLVTGTWTAAPNFTAASIFGSQGITESNPHQQMLSCATTSSISNVELVELSNNPWEIFSQSPSKSSLVLNLVAAVVGDAFQADAFQTDAFQTTATTGITATLAVTLDGVAVASSSTVGHSTTLAVTLDSVATSFAATTGHSASLAVTLDTVAVASVATVGHPATLAITLDDIVFAAAATTANGITANIAFTLDGVLYNSAIVSGHSATIAFALDDISVNITAVNSNPGPITGYVETLLVLRTFTDRKRF